MTAARNAQERFKFSGRRIDSRLIREVCGNFVTGITVVTTLSAGRPVGRTVNSFTSLSLEPPLILVCLHRDAALLAGVREHGSFAVNILTGEQRAVSRSFVSGDSGQFVGVPSMTAHNGTPVLVESMAYLVCDTYQEFEGGDHVIMVGKVVEVEILRVESEPLTFFRGEHGLLTDTGRKGK